MSIHRSPQTSARRHPIAAERRTNIPISAECSSARREQPACLFGRGRIDRCTRGLRQGGVPCRVHRDPAPLHCLAQRAAQHGVHLADAGGGEAILRQPQVVGVEVGGRDRGHLACPHRGDQPLHDDAVVLAGGGGGEAGLPSAPTTSRAGARVCGSALRCGRRRPPPRGAASSRSACRLVPSNDALRRRRLPVTGSGGRGTRSSQRPGAFSRRLPRMRGTVARPGGFWGDFGGMGRSRGSGPSASQASDLRFCLYPPWDSNPEPAD